MENDKDRSSDSKDGDTQQAIRINEANARFQGEDTKDCNGLSGGSGEEEEAAAESGPCLVGEQPPRSSARTPFTNLSQIDADLALARTLQEQERAYMMLSMNNEMSDYGSWETGSYLHDGEDDFDDPNDDNERDDDDDDDDDDDVVGEDEYGITVEVQGEDAFDVHGRGNGEEDNSANIEIDPGVFSCDEAYARALQEAEERDIAARLFALAGLSDGVEHAEDHGHNPQDVWEDVDPDQLTYEELLALGEVVGTESRGLSADTIASLPSISYKAGSKQNGTNESCVICRLDYEDGDNLMVLSCKHSYHPECINNWLKINKLCPVCSTEVSTSRS